jgi:predicted permease
MLHDLKYAWRRLAGRPGHAALSIVILALGIGAATAIWSVSDAVLFRALPYADPDRVVFVWDSTPQRPVTNLTPGRLIDLRSRARSFHGVAGIGHVSVTLTGSGLPERFSAASVSSNFFDILGATPALGGVFHEGEADRQLVVLSHALWQQRFGGREEIVGTSLTLEGRPHTVAGIMPRSFYWTSITVSPSAGPHPELWVISPANELPGLPVAYEGDLRLNRRMGYLRGVARLKEGVTFEQAQADLTELSRQLAQEHPETDRARGSVLISAREQLLRHATLPVAVLLGAAVLLFAASVANVANLQLMRLAGRRRELAVQSALGAGRSRVARELVLESLVVCGAGTIVGSAGGTLALALLKNLVPLDVPRLEQAGIDPRSVALLFAVSALAGALVAISPLARRSMGTALGTGDRSGTMRVSARTRRTLVAAEIATAVVLLTGAVLFGRSLAQLQRVDVGIPDVDRLLTFNIVLSGDRRMMPPPQRVAFYETVMERLRAIPSVRGAGTAATLPIGGDDFGTSVTIEGRTDQEPSATGLQVVSAGWFDALGMPVLRGRDFTTGDTGEHGLVVMVNQAFARQHWGNEEAVGRRVRMGRREPWATIVGVVADIRHLGPKRPPRAEVYVPQYQESFSFTAVAVRTAGDPLSIVDQVRREVAALDASQPISAVATMGEHLRRAQAETRALWSLTALFGALALIIAALGVYGAVAFSVAQRMREFGVRLALGAAPRQVGSQVVRETLATAAAGVIAGVVLAFAGSRAMQALLFETAPTTAMAYVVSALALGSIAALAAWLPARGAMRADPAAVLRGE